MVKSYLRYVGETPFGVIASANANVCLHRNGIWAITPALQDIHILHLQQGTLLHTLSYPPTTSSSPLPSVRCLRPHPLDPHLLAAGYDDGSLRLFSLHTFAPVLTLHGHTSAITALLFNPTGALLFSASADTTVTVWDVVAERGVVRLKGHRDAVTGLMLLDSPALGHHHLVSSSKDGTLRVWDLTTQHCVQTLAGGKEVWAMVANAEQTLLITGGVDDSLKLLHIATLTPPSTPLTPDTKPVSTPDDEDLLRPWGPLPRQGRRRITALTYSPDEQLLLALSADKVVEMWAVRGQDWIDKRRRKRRRKAAKEAKAAGEASQEGEAEGVADELLVEDLFTPLPLLRGDKKVVSAAFAPPPSHRSSAAPTSHRLLLSQADNSLHLFGLHLPSLISPPTPEAEPYPALTAVELLGHRTPVRALSLSPDASVVMSASGEEVKLWNIASHACVRTFPSGPALCSLFVPGAGHVVVGTKDGDVEIYEVNSARCLGKVRAHEGGGVYAMELRKDGRGFATGGGDKTVKQWDFTLEVDPATPPTPPGTAPAPVHRVLGIALARTLTLTDDVLCLRHSPDGKYVAVGLLDSTVKVFHADTLLFHLSLYGHRLPVLAVDFSSDSALLVSGSADKNVKVWGTGFGDCHCSLFAHADSVTQTRFVRGTHYFVSAGKDGAVKLWDADTREMIQELRGHTAEVWALDVAAGGPAGEFIVSAGNDRSIRVWRQGEELLFLEEEREKRRDEAADERVQPRVGQLGTIEGVGSRVEVEGELVTSGVTAETLQGGERLMEALDLAEAEQKRIDAHRAQTEGSAPMAGAGEGEGVGSVGRAMAQMGGGKGEVGKAVGALAVNPFMQGQTPAGYVMGVLTGLPLPALDDCLLMLPFSYALRLLRVISEALEGDEGRVEVAVHSTLLLVATHERQLISNRAHIGELKRLRLEVRRKLRLLKDRYGRNRATLRLLQDAVEESKTQWKFGS